MVGLALCTCPLCGFRPLDRLDVHGSDRVLSGPIRERPFPVTSLATIRRIHTFFFETKLRSIKQDHQYRQPCKIKRLQRTQRERQPPLPPTRTEGTPPPTSLWGASKGSSRRPSRKGPLRPGLSSCGGSPVSDSKTASSPSADPYWVRGNWVLDQLIRACGSGKKIP